MSLNANQLSNCKDIPFHLAFYALKQTLHFFRGVPVQRKAPLAGAQAVLAGPAVDDLFAVLAEDNTTVGDVEVSLDFRTFANVAVKPHRNHGEKSRE